MREIIFRGKRLDNGEWAEGYLYEHEPALVGIVSENDVPEPSKWFIARTAFADWNMPRLSEFIEVDPSTVGQYTGLKDKNGKKIFEGDIVHILGNQNVADWKSVNYNALIAFLDGGFCAIDGTIEDHAFRRYALARMDFDLEVIGNVHDNPELLKEEEQT